MQPEAVEWRHRWAMATLRSAFTLAALFLFAVPASPGGRSDDPLARDIARWSETLENRKSTDAIWTQIKEGSATYIAAAEKALAGGRPGLALLELARTRLQLEAALFIGARSASERKDMAAFEAAWKKSGATLADLAPASAKTLSGVSPAIVRAVAEVAYLQVSGYYHASLDFAHNTDAESGYFQLGLAHGQEALVRLCRAISASGSARVSGAQPPLRSLGVELDALQNELVAAYRPPASIDRHRDFITASSVLKEARELDGAGLRHGALLRYLQTVGRVAQLRAEPPKIDEAALRDLEVRLADAAVDHSIARTLLDQARGGAPEALAAVASDVLPRYFAALEAPKPAPPLAAAEVTVTLVRWPYT